MKLGIVGLPNVGKSTLFNAITKAGAESANYPFCTIEPNVGVVAVPDERLNVLGKVYNTKKIVQTAIEFYDIAGLVKGASKGEGLGNKFLGHIREVEAIVHVVRCFEDSNIVHVDGKIDPLNDIETINLELIFSDLELLDRRIQKTQKNLKGDKSLQKELDILNKVHAFLETGKSARAMELDDDEREFVKSLDLLSFKPVIYAANVSEDDVVIGENKYTKLVKDYASKENASVVVMCCKMESELAELNDDDKKNFLAELGINYSGLDKLIFATYDLLGLQTFFTVGKDEVRAWTFKKGMKAPECAGLIHSDFQRGFIKAEVTSFNDLAELGNEKKVQEAGKKRLEGKDYLMQDGDIVLFRFNV